MSAGGEAGRWGSRRIWEMVFLFGALAVAFVLSEGLLRDKTGPEDAEPAPAGERWAGAVARVESREIRDSVEASGRVAAVRTARVAARVQAQVERVEVRAGARVTAGQLLVTLDARELESRRRGAASAVAAAAARAEQAARDRARQERLAAEGVVSPQALESARETEAVAVAELASARDAARAEADVASLAQLGAPFDGVVSDRLVDPGDLASPGQPLLLIADDSAFRVEASVDESSAVELSAGASARCRVEALGIDQTCAIAEIVPAADVATRTVLVKADLPAHGGLQPGLFARLVLDGPPRAALLVPAASVQRIGGLASVRVVDAGGVARLRNVRTGREHGSDVEVLSGVAAGETVALP